MEYPALSMWRNNAWPAAGDIDGATVGIAGAVRQHRRLMPEMRKERD